MLKLSILMNAELLIKCNKGRDKSLPLFFMNCIVAVRSGATGASLPTDIILNSDNNLCHKQVSVDFNIQLSALKVAKAFCN